MHSLRLHTVYVASSIFLWAGQNSSFAAEKEPVPQGLSAGNGLAETVSLASSIGKVIGALAVIFFLMMVLVYFIKKSGLDLRSKKEGSLIQVIETRMIAPKKYISIVEIAGKYISLGVTEQNINLLTELPEPPSLQTALQQKNAPPFAGVLKKSVANLRTGRDKEDSQGGKQ